MTIYTEAVAAGLEMDHHETDLYLLDTPEARDILAKAGKEVDGWNVQRFRSQIDGRFWLDIPFAYEPAYKKA